MVALTFALVLLGAWTVTATYLLLSGSRLASAAVNRSFQLQDFYEQQGAEYRRVVQAAVAEAQRTRRGLEQLEKAANERAGIDGRLIELARRQTQIESRQSALVRLAENVAGAPVAAISASMVPVPPQRPAGLRERTRSLIGPADDDAPAVNIDPDAELDPGEPMEDRHGALDGSLGEGRGLRPAAPFVALGERDMHELLAILFDRVRQLETDQVRNVQLLAAGSASRATLLTQAAETAGRELADIVEPVRSRAALSVEAVTRPMTQDGSAFGQALAEIRRNALVIRRLAPVVDRLPIRRPVTGESRISSRFGPRSDPFLGTARLHAGQDFATPLGTPIYSTGNGVVLSAGWGDGYGNLVQVDHGNGLVTRYAHLSEINVSVGQPVAAGAQVGKAGSTGRSTGPHLHYETRLHNVPNDPMRLLRVGEQLSLARPGGLAPVERGSQL